MKKIITISCFYSLFVVLFFIAGTQTACQKQNTNCTCVITVKDTSTAVSGATVRLYAPHGSVGATGTTNAGGDVDFTFALPAIFNVAVTKPGSTPGDTLKGSGIIQLQIGQTESTTVIIH